MPDRRLRPRIQWQRSMKSGRSNPAARSQSSGSPRPWSIAMLVSIVSSNRYLSWRTMPTCRRSGRVSSAVESRPSNSRPDVRLEQDPPHRAIVACPSRCGRPAPPRPQVPTFHHSRLRPLITGTGTGPGVSTQAPPQLRVPLKRADRTTCEPIGPCSAPGRTTSFQAPREAHLLRDWSSSQWRELGANWRGPGDGATTSCKRPRTPDRQVTAQRLRPAHPQDDTKPAGPPAERRLVEHDRESARNTAPSVSTGTASCGGKAQSRRFRPLTVSIPDRVDLVGLILADADLECPRRWGAARARKGASRGSTGRLGDKRRRARGSDE